MHHRYLVTPIVLTTLLIACGSSDSSIFDNGGTADSGTPTPVGTTPPPFSRTDGGGTDPGASCPSQTLCGAAATCCAAGQDCVDNACIAGCATGVRCGSVCCATGQVCLSQACVPLGKSCGDSFDCEETEFCEPTVGRCLPQPAEAGLCTYKPPVLPLDLVLEWSWTGSTVVHPEFGQVINTAIVVDLDNLVDATGAKSPEVIIVTSKNFDPANPGATDTAFGSNDPAYLRILDGKTGLEKWVDPNLDVFSVDNQVNPRGTPAAADLDGDGKIEIVVPKRGGGLIAFDATGKLLWKSTTADGLTPYNPSFNSVAIAIADMDNDGKAEIVVGGLVFDNLGRVIGTPKTGQPLWGSNDVGYGPVSIIADVDMFPLLNKQQVVTGNRAFDKDGTMVWDVSAYNDPVYGGVVPDGYPAIADLDKDGTPELVVVGAGILRVQNALTGHVIDKIAMPFRTSAGRGGPPTIADFDNDGFMEIASANGDLYSVFEYDATKPVGQKLSVKWSKPTQDKSSNVTGSSVFDFEGDGSAEVIYNDECYSRVYKGTDGSELYKIPNSSATIHEMPVLVDVDGDNNTELVTVANDRNHLAAPVGSPFCADYTAGITPRHGVFVYGDKHDKWVRTRKIWNQHAYHITNILADGKVPAVEPPSFTTAQNNDYRVSSQGKGVYNAPDLRVDLEVSIASCPASIDLRARVKNAGALGVAAGVKVHFYAGADATGQAIGDKLTTKALLPGESEVLLLQYPTGSTPASAFFVAVEGTNASGAIDECLADNNSAAAGGIRCPTVN